MDTRQAKIDALKSAQMGKNPFINQQKYWIFNDSKIFLVDEHTLELTEKTEKDFSQLNGPEDYCTWPMGEEPPQYRKGQGVVTQKYKDCLFLVEQMIRLSNYKPKK